MPGIKISFKRFIFIVFLHFSAHALGDFNLSPVFFLEKENPVYSERLRFLGPLGQYREVDDGASYYMAFCPFWSSSKVGTMTKTDLIWPFCAWRSSGEDLKWRVLLFYSSCNDRDNKRIDCFFPFWFSGRDRDGAFFWAFVPFYGDMRNVFGYRDIYFIMFPLYFSSRRDGVAGESYFWPFVNYDSGNGIHKFRVFPFYARNEREGKFVNIFCAWPFYNSMESLNPEKPGGGWMLWPFAGHFAFSGMRSWSFFWPFFQIASNEKGGRELNIFWPFFQYSNALSGKDEFKLYFWPFYGERASEGNSSRFFLWPFVVSEKDENALLNTEQFRIFPFLWMEDVCDEKGNSVEFHRIFWPFFTLQSKGKTSSLKILDFFPERILSGVDRNWSPLWAFFDYRSCPNGYSYDLLWGMVSGYGYSSKKKERFSISGIYDSKLDALKSRRDFLCGAFSIVSERGKDMRFKLFWLLEF